jgi:serine/threonine protein kinase
LKQICLQCERSSTDSNLFCHEPSCPAEMSPHILEYGELLGDIEIIRLVTVLRSATLYEGQVNKKKIMLKIAHPGPEHTNRIKREVKFLQDIASKKTNNSGLPRLIPPYSSKTSGTEGYGKAMFKGNLLYFFLFEFFEGEPLRDSLIKNPQLWVYHIGWLEINLARTVAILHSKGILHCGLCPESILVRFEGDPAVPTILLIDLGIVSTPDNIINFWYKEAVLPAYTAPELLGIRPFADYRTDVYGVGLILYELLIGQPAFPFRLSNDSEVYEAVKANRRVPMNRIEDVKPAAILALRFSMPNPSERPNNVADALKELLSTAFEDTPETKRDRGLSPRTTFMLLAILLITAIVITVLLNIVLSSV